MVKKLCSRLRKVGVTDVKKGDTTDEIQLLDQVKIMETESVMTEKEKAVLDSFYGM